MVFSFLQTARRIRRPTPKPFTLMVEVYFFIHFPKGVISSSLMYIRSTSEFARSQLRAPVLSWVRYASSSPLVNLQGAHMPQWRSCRREFSTRLGPMPHHVLVLWWGEEADEMQNHLGHRPSRKDGSPPLYLLLLYFLSQRPRFFSF